jgi:glycerol-3-phosphate dehydrogenase (NAD(P)+)
MSAMQRFGVIGGGAWGTALAQVLRRADRDVVIWAREADVVAGINTNRTNPLFLPGVALDSALRATGDLAEAARADALLLVVPAQHLRATCRQFGGALAPSTPLIICAKGIEEESGALLSEVVASSQPQAAVAVLSGPTFAAEVAQGLPTAITLAASDAALGQRLIAAIGTREFRPYLTDDVAGAQIGGAVKNVMAIACGVVMGRGFGDNARAALITRGLAEMVRLALAKGGKAETLMGLSGLGDLTLTCSSTQSRNHSLGLALGRGEKLEAYVAGRRSVAEGVSSSAAAAALARKLQIEMPIVTAVDAILHHGAAIDEVIEALLTRPFKAEAPRG